MKTKTALKKQNYESAKILVPKSMFKKDGDAISFMLNMSACKKQNKEDTFKIDRHSFVSAEKGIIYAQNHGGGF